MDLRRPLTPFFQNYYGGGVRIGAGLQDKFAGSAGGGDVLCDDQP